MRNGLLTYFSAIIGVSLFSYGFFSIQENNLFLASTHSLPRRLPASNQALLSSTELPTDEEDDPSTAFRLAQSPFNEDGKLSCAYSALMLSYLDELPDQEVISLLEEEVKQYESFIRQTQKTASRKTKRLQRKVLNDLKILIQSKDPASHLKKSLVLPCQAGVALGGTLVRLTGLTGTLLTTAITTPIRFVSKFGIAAFTRKQTPERGPSYPDLMGVSGAITQTVGLAQQAIRVVLNAGSPWALARTVIFSFDMEAQKACARVNPRNPREVRFCSRYKKIKENEFKLTEVGERWGIQVGESLLHVFDFRSDQKANERLCQTSVNKQFRVARRAIERLRDHMKTWGVEPDDIKIVPPEIEGCISIQILVSQEADQETITQEGTGWIDGVPYSTILTQEYVPPLKEPKPDPTTDEEVCGAIHSTQVVFANSLERLRLQKKAMIEAVFNPKRFAQMGIDPVTTPSQFLYREPLENIANKRSLILILAPTAEQRADFEKIREHFNQLQQDFKKRRKKLSQLAKTKNYQECLKKQEKLGFNYQEFKEISDSLSSIQVSNRITEFEQFVKETKQAGKKLYLFKKLKLPWEVLELSSLNEIRRALSDPNVAHIIFVSHGESNGKIIDPRFNSLPASAFEWLSPSIESVSFFACHTRDAMVSYQLKEHLSSQPTVHPIRYAGYVETSGIFDEENQAPVLALSHFIEDVDREMFIAQEGTRRAQSLGWWSLPKAPPISLCSVNIKRTHVLNGGFAIKVNSKWIGVLYPETPEKTEFPFPCHWIQEKKNRIFLENINLTEKSSLFVDQPEVTLQVKDHIFSVPPTPGNGIKRRPGDQSISAVSFSW